MTSKLTREQATDTEIQMLIDSHEKGTAMFMRTDAYYFMAKELQERRKADSEPVGYFGRFDPDDEGFIDQCSKNVKGAFPLYRHAQPAPVASFYRDGIEAAAKWLDQQREAYDSEHGWSDPGTGTFEFGNDAQRDYSSTLEELAEGIRALHPNTGNSPVIPDSARDALEKALAAMEFMGDTLNNLDAVCTEDVELVAPAFDAVRSVLEAAPQEVR